MEAARLAPRSSHPEPSFIHLYFQPSRSPRRSLITTACRERGEPCSRALKARRVCVASSHMHAAGLRRSASPVRLCLAARCSNESWSAWVESLIQSLACGVHIKKVVCGLAINLIRMAHRNKWARTCSSDRATIMPSPSNSNILSACDAHVTPNAHTLVTCLICSSSRPSSSVAQRSAKPEHSFWQCSSLAPG